MPLSTQAQNYADAVFQSEIETLNIEHNETLNRLVPNIGRVIWTERELADYCVKWIQKVVDARIAAYIKAYDQFGVELTQDEVDFIKPELDSMITKEYGKFAKQSPAVKNALPPFNKNIQDQLDRVLSAAGKRLSLIVKERTVKKLNAPALPTPIPMDFSFIKDNRIKSIIERDYAELQKLSAETHPKSVLILSGGIIEGLLIDALVKSGEWTEQEAFERFLAKMIHPSKARGIITHDNITEVLRVFRNIVHPAREIRDNLTFTPDHARHARTSVDVIITEVRQWHASNP
jgi:hypothetical protein